MSPTTCGVVRRGGRKGAGEGGEGKEEGGQKSGGERRKGRPERGGENGERRRVKEGGRMKDREWGEEIISLCA